MSSNLKINGYGRQSSENLFCSRGESIYNVCSLEIGLSPSPFSLGVTLKGKNLLPWNLRLLLKERICSPSTIKVKNKKRFSFDLSDGMEKCKMLGKRSGKSQGILRLLISGNPALLIYHHTTKFVTVK